MSVQTISPQELKRLKESGKPVELIDVRTPLEFREVHVDCACNVPLDTIDPARIFHNRHSSSDMPLYVICRSGGRAAQACEKFITAGFPNVVNVEGGTLACVEAGLLVVRGKRSSRSNGKSASPPVCWCSSASRWDGSCIRPVTVFQRSSGRD